MNRILAFAFTLVGLLGWQSSAVASPLAPGCDSSHLAVAHYADGTLASSSGAPVTCSVTTGYGGAESHIEVSPDGVVAAWPASTAKGTGGSGVGPDGPDGTAQSHTFNN